MNVFFRNALVMSIAVGAVALANCSGGVSVPAAGTTSAPTGTSSTAPATTTTTAPAGTATTAPATTTTTAPATTTTTAPATTNTTAPATTPTPTTAPMMNGCPPTFPSPQPTASATALPTAGGTINIPNFGDQTGTIVFPKSNASAGSQVNFLTSQNTFTDSGGNGNIPTPPSGYTALSYTASYISPAQTFSFGGDEDIVVSAKAPCEITFPGTYVAFVYANGGGFNHSELSPTTGYPANETSAMNGTISFTIDLSSTMGLNPTGVNLETIFASKQ